MNDNAKLLREFALGGTTLKNSMVMAPLTRSRADDNNIPTDIMATYYGQRSGAGLIITEGTSPSPNGLGYPFIPGIFNEEQVAGWQKVTSTVHENGGKIFIQLMHTGRISHPENLPQGAKHLAPSPIAPENTKMFVPDKGELPIPTPNEMDTFEIEEAINEYVQAANNAMEAGFDGIELHGANGYLLEQFLNPLANKRTDNYGGSAENRCRFALEVAQSCIEAIGADKVGIRLSPNGAFNDVGPFDNQEETFHYLCDQLSKLGVIYVHLVNHESMGATPLPNAIRQYYKAHFSGALILSGGYDAESAEADLHDDQGDLVAFGRKFLANPDLVARFKQDAPLNEPKPDYFYAGGEKGYIDYPTME